MVASWQVEGVGPIVRCADAGIVASTLPLGKVFSWWGRNDTPGASEDREHALPAKDEVGDEEGSTVVGPSSKSLVDSIVATKPLDKRAT